MSLWEYKIITSGKGGFATPALLESFLNQLGREEWEILDFRPQPDNPLAFTGLARRPTQRDWTLEDAVAAAARAEADKLRTEFAAKFKEAARAGEGGAQEEPAETLASTERAATDEGFRKPRDTERDLDPEAEEGDEWDQLASEDELPSFFEAIRPHLRRNQRGPGMSVGTEYLAKKWGLAEEEIVGALKECGFAVPEEEKSEPSYLEYDGDLYWVNRNRRGELWINTKEKPQRAFRVVPGKKVELGEEERGGRTEDGAEEGKRREERAERPDGKNPEGPAEPLPEGPALLEKIRPHMRRNRREPGGSGSLTFLSRALKCAEQDLAAGFAALGLTPPENSGDKPSFLEIGDRLWWLNKDQRGGVWINERKAKARSEEKGDKPEERPENQEVASGWEGPDGDRKSGGAPLDPPAEAKAGDSSSGSPLAAVRLLLKRTKTGSFAGETGKLAETLGKPREEFLSALTAEGLQIPEKPRAKPVFVEHAGEIFWLNKNAKDELWLNAKPSKFAGKA